MVSLLRNAGSFFWAHKKMWLRPLVVMLLLLGAIILYAQVSGVRPFIHGQF